MSGEIHFWTLQKPEDIEGWDPDLAPAVFMSGHGHAFLELFARLRSHGDSVSIGPWPPSEARCMVVSLKELTRSAKGIHPISFVRLIPAALRCRSIVVVRADVPLSIEVPSFVTRVVMPNRSSVNDASVQIYLPLFPQRGLKRRDEQRADRISVVVLKAHSYNVPAWFLEQPFRDGVASLGLSLRLDTELDEPNRWDDFSEVDVALCLQQTNFDSNGLEHRRKPPTKLVNSWVAGSIPIVSPIGSYLDLVERGRNALVAQNANEVLEQLRLLCGDGQLVEQLRAGVAEAARAYEVAELQTQWSKALSTSPRTTRLAVLVDLFRTGPSLVWRWARHRVGSYRKGGR